MNWSHPGVFKTRREAIEQLRGCIDYMERFTRPGVEDAEADGWRRIVSRVDSPFSDQMTIK